MRSGGAEESKGGVDGNVSELQGQFVVNLGNRARFLGRQTYSRIFLGTLGLTSLKLCSGREWRR